MLHETLTSMSGCRPRRLDCLLFRPVRQRATVTKAVPSGCWKTRASTLRSRKSAGPKGIEHLGVQVENEAELAEVYGRLKAANGPVMEEGATTCCYAKSEKSWIADPDGVVWEAFLTMGDSTVYGESPDFASLASDNAPHRTRAARPRLTPPPNHPVAERR